MGSPVTVDARHESALPGAVTVRIHALWDELSDFGAHETDAALNHAMQVLSGLVGAQRAFWLGAVRLGSAPDASRSRPRTPTSRTCSASSASADGPG